MREEILIDPELLLATAKQQPSSVGSKQPPPTGPPVTESCDAA